ERIARDAVAVGEAAALHDRGAARNLVFARAHLAFGAQPGDADAAVLAVVADAAAALPDVGGALAVVAVVARPERQQVGPPPPRGPRREDEFVDRMIAALGCPVGGGDGRVAPQFAVYRHPVAVERERHDPREAAFAAATGEGRLRVRFRAALAGGDLHRGRI